MSELSDLTGEHNFNQEKQNIFSSINALFNAENENILNVLYLKGLKRISVSDLDKCGFSCSILVMNNSLVENQLLGNITYYSVNHFIGFDLISDNNHSSHFNIIKTYNSKEKVEMLNKIRDKKIEIDGLENAAYMYEHEFHEKSSGNIYREKAKKASLELSTLEKMLLEIK